GGGGGGGGGRGAAVRARGEDGPSVSSSRPSSQKEERGNFVGGRRGQGGEAVGGRAGEGGRGQPERRVGTGTVGRAGLEDKLSPVSSSRSSSQKTLTSPNPLNPQPQNLHPETPALAPSAASFSSSDPELHPYSLASYSDELFTSLRGLQREGLLTDCEVNLHGNLLRFHGVVLAAVSQRVEAWLRAGKAELDAGLRELSGGRVATAAGFQAVLEFAYGGEVMAGASGSASGPASASVPASTSASVLEEAKAASRYLGVPQLVEMLKGSGAPCGPKDRMQCLQVIRSLWLNRIGCDVHIQTADGERIPAHRVILAAGADYFQALFCGGLRECNQDVVCLRGVTSSALRPLLAFLYCGTLQLGWCCVWELAEAAHQFQLQGALSLCFSFLTERMDPSSCLDVLALAEAYGLSELQEAAERYILAHFQSVAEGEKFRDLPCAQLERLLGRDALSVESEIVVFRAVLCWIEEERERRLPQLPGLLGTVRLPLMSPSELQEVRRCSLLRQSRGGRAVLEEVLGLLEGNGTATTDCPPRTANQVLVLVGGDSVDDDFARREPNHTLWVARRFLSGPGLIRTVEWRPLARLPEPPRFRHCVCVLQNKLYVIGGRKYYGYLDVLKSALRFDPAQAVWEPLPDMSSPRDYFAAACVDGKVFAIGGNLDDTHYLDTVEYFTPEDNTWRLAHPLPSALCGLAAAVWDNQIFLSGGCDASYRCHASTWHYHPVRGCTARAPMLTREGRAGHVMLPLVGFDGSGGGGRGGLVVAGGLHPACGGGFGDQLQCEIYSPERNTWCLFPVLPRPHLSPAATALGGQLYLLGGSSADTARDTQWVHRYDPREGRWDKLGAMPRPYTDLCACALQLPQGVKG
ncbi:kelch-like protein 33, partial [Engraulis encrasicolus]|uniref:kelch-like protein 33 n=1 Tax=Engraulis encrasicolus TaxID=184585 RepID=UPI002FD3487B